MHLYQTRLTDYRGFVDVAVGTTIDRTSAEADLLGRLPEKSEPLLRILQRRHSLATFTHELAVPLSIPFTADPKREPLGLETGRQGLSGH